MSSTSRITSTSRVAIAGSVAVIAALAVSGCAGPPSEKPTAERTTSQSTASASPSASETATAAASDDLSFEDGAALSASTLPAFGLEISALEGWTQTGDDSTTGAREYTKSDGTVATITQQRITDLDPTMGDRAATEQLFRASGFPVDQLEEQLLPTFTGGTAQFLSIGGHETDGPWSATVARAFARPGAALIVKVQTSSQEALRQDLHDILINAQVVLT